MDRDGTNEGYDLELTRRRRERRRRARDRLRRRWHARPPRRGARGGRRRCAVRVDLPLRPAHVRGGQGASRAGRDRRARLRGRWRGRRGRASRCSPCPSLPAPLPGGAARASRSSAASFATPSRPRAAELDLVIEGDAGALRPRRSAARSLRMTRSAPRPCTARTGGSTSRSAAARALPAARRAAGRRAGDDRGGPRAARLHRQRDRCDARRRGARASGALEDLASGPAASPPRRAASSMIRRACCGSRATPSGSASRSSRTRRSSRRAADFETLQRRAPRRRAAASCWPSPTRPRCSRALATACRSQLDRALILTALELAPPDADRGMFVLAAITQDDAWLERLEFTAARARGASRARPARGRARRRRRRASCWRAWHALPVEAVALAGARGRAGRRAAVDR